MTFFQYRAIIEEDIYSIKMLIIQKGMKYYGIYYTPCRKRMCG